MELPIPNKLKKLWDVWDIPTCILLSLFLQVFLVLFASFKQRSKNSFLLFLIWSAYLSADWIAAVTLGLITKVLTDPFHDPHVNEELHAFWASFLLLHLGGPDSITSFALEDNEFWLRHLFGLNLQVMGAAYCIFLTLPNNSLWIPTILVFVVGSVKYAERTVALYLASLDHFEDTVGDFEDPNAELEPEGAKFDFNLPSESNDIELLMLSYSLFKSFKGIIFQHPLSSKLVESSRKLFCKIKNPNVGFKLMEYELSFMYEVFHTKAAAVRSRIGLVFRLSSFCFILGAFILFHFVVKDHDDKFGGFETSLTYALLIGAIVLDAISGIKLMLFSDWILVSNNGLIKRWRKFIPAYILKRKRWCESVSKYNMIDYCLDERRLWKRNLPDCVRAVVDKITNMLFSSSEDDIEDLKSFIFEKGVKFLDEVHDEDEFLFATKVLHLHLTTEIGYHQKQTESGDNTEEAKSSRRICKVISDYMFYILIMKPEILGPSVMGIKWKKNFKNAVEEAKKYLVKYQISDHTKACNAFLDYHNTKEKGGRQTLLSNACSSAKDLKLEKNWKLLSDWWAELLFFGALRNRPILYAQQASKGGELLTFTSFLLHHSSERNDKFKEENFTRHVSDGSQHAS
ncbi:uncharacterized protein LOC107431337 [Ziziphus jujuba]|uniref:Uncharacterized protein LOC107431337 n=1 Tax=Ziziphus jujuba TaxID=326968 RepID=A0A6P3YQI4_ZIZJJ|nr:uncharacterized protein LOC107431337 [Ziziphus jujuba]